MIGRTVGTHYVVSKLLGRGLRSATYLAEHRSLHRDVVVKLLDNPWGSDTAAASRFDQAARSLSTLEAPNIAALIDSGRDPGRGLFVVTEFIVGDSLETFLGDRGALSLEEFVPLAAQILKGLGAAHLRGLLHLDITLDNIYLSRDDADPSRGLVRLLDLGLVQLVEGHVQGHVQGLEAPTTGDTRYLAPEQISNKPLDTRTDVYAVGALFYQMLAGLPPFSGTDAQIIYKHVNEVPPPLADQVDEPLPSELIELIEQCLSKDPNERPVDANEIVELLIDSVPAALFRGYVPPPKAVVAAAAAAAAVASAVTSADDDAEDLSDALDDDDDDDDIANPAASADARVAAPLLGVGLTETQDDQRPEPVDPSKRKPSIGDLSISEPKSSSNSWTVTDEAVTSASGASLTVDEPVATPIEEEKKGGGTGFFVFLLLVGIVVGAIFVVKPELLGLGPKPLPQQPAAPPPATTVEAPVEDVPTLLAKAQALEAKGDVVGASAVYHQILAEDPTHEDATVRLAALTGSDSDASSTTGGTTGTTGTETTDGDTTTGGDGTETDAESDGTTAETTGDETTGTTTGGDNEAGTVEVEFDVKPRGTLYVDGKKLGKVPGTLSLPLGKHTLKIDGGSRHKPWEERVDVAVGMAPMEIKLKRKPKDLSGENIDIDPMAEGPATEFKFKK